MKITPWFTHPQAILGVYEWRCIYVFLLSDEYNPSYIKNVLALPSFKIAVNGGQDFEAQKSASIHHKKVPHMIPGGLLKQSEAFVSEKISIFKTLWTVISSANCHTCIHERVRSNECRSAEERAKQNTSYKLEAWPWERGVLRVLQHPPLQDWAWDFPCAPQSSPIYLIFVVVLWLIKY